MSWKNSRKFDNCTAKKVEINLVAKNTETQETTSGTVPAADVAKYVKLGFEAILHCPKTTDDERVKMRTKNFSYLQSAAYDELKETAGGILCHNCVYAGMGEVEVIQHRTARAKAEAERLLAFSQLEVARHQAQQELAEIGVELPRE